ncbi:MarR family winged helix-turn-helix transcriptional regulator [Cohnella sp. AR92]|uniref:MarR family winged helix-turn-helix transcriptional regulator n=1 Tax=Cohnella sp. AR92 TaxID=648716 RepID=UPI000F8E6BD5|nr:MarR family transcriptional regulator [Cohnella sp. AR92]RUS49233.1 MarR family transcriptional regulator [Cohnella sp. AR92]
MRHVLKDHRAHVDRLIRAYEVYPGQPPLLLRLSDADGLSQRELAESKGVKPATLTVMLQRMEKTGLIRRAADEKDQRVTRVRLTDKGREAAEAVRHAINEVEARSFEGFLPEEKLLLRRFLLQMMDNLTSWAPED